MSGTAELLRHLLASIAFRLQMALRDAPPEFADFRAGEGVRTPREILLHMAELVSYVLAKLRGEASSRLEARQDLPSEAERFHSLLAELSEVLESGDVGEGVAERLLQGPLGDALSHVGQLTMLRRLAGYPVAAVNYYRAPIERDNVSPVQPLP